MRGLWIDDPDTGTKFRLGNVSYEMAAEFARHGNRRAMTDVMRHPHFGFWVEKTF